MVRFSECDARNSLGYGFSGGADRPFDLGSGITLECPVSDMEFHTGFYQRPGSDGADNYPCGVSDPVFVPIGLHRPALS